MKVAVDKKTNNGLMALLSVVSIILVFTLTCFLCLYSLSALGVVSVDWAQEPQVQPPKSEPVGENIDTDESEVSLLSDEKLRDILVKTPFVDNYYVEMYIGVYSDNTQYSTEAYRIWKHGAKYRIVRYDEHMTAHQTIVCDGEAVKVTDIDSNTGAVYPISELFGFELVSGIPDFSVFRTGKYSIDSCEYSDGMYRIICSFGELNTIDEIHINDATGAVMYYKSSLGGVRIIEYYVNQFMPDYDFSDVSFSLMSN